MFYQYSYPIQFYQHLHNKLPSFIIKTGQILGLIWFKLSSDGRTFISCSKSTQIWLITLTTFQIAFLIFMPYYLKFIRGAEGGSNTLSEALVAISDVLYSAVVGFMYGIAFFCRKLILKLGNSSMHFLNVKPELYSKVVEDERKCLLLHLTIKMILDLCFTLPAILYVTQSFEMHPTVLSFLFVISRPIAVGVYCFISTFYYIPFAFGLFFVKMLLDTVYITNLHSVSFWYQKIYKYVRKINNLMGWVMFLFFFQAFVALVGEVSLYICS